MMNSILDPMLHVTILWTISCVILILKKKVSPLFYLGFTYFILLHTPLPLTLYQTVKFKVLEEIPAHADGAIILSGGTLCNRPDRYATLWMGQNSRFLTGIQLFFDGKVDELIFTGHDIPDGCLSEVVSMKQTAMGFKIPENKIVTEDESISTKEHPIYLKKLIPEYSKKTFFLVTSAPHMKRALEVFELNGFKVYPLISNETTESYSGWHNHAVYLRYFYYESLALVYYRVGRLFS